MRRKRVLATALAILLAACSKNPSQPQEGSMRGMATFEGQEDHSGIVVQIQELGRQTTTRASGDYSFSSLPTGTYSLLASDGDTTRHLFDFATLAGLSVAKGRETVAPAMELSQFRRIEDDIVGEAFWTAQEGPYLITRSITVQPGGRLIVTPGAIVKFEDYYRLNIQGGLIAKGTATDSIQITSMRRNGAPGDWDRISIQGSRKESADTLKYCKIQYANIGVDCSQISPLICDNTIENCSGYALVFSVSDPAVRRNLIHGNYGGISCEIGTSGIIQANTIRENTTAGIACAGSHPEIRDNVISDNDRGLQAQSESDPLVWHNLFLNNVDAIYLFYYCDPRIEANHISGHQRFGMHLVGYNSPEIHFNNIVQNDSYVVYLKDQFKDVLAQNNWWDTIDQAMINTLVWDGFDDNRLGKVLLDPILTAPVDSAGPSAFPE